MFYCLWASSPFLFPNQQILENARLPRDSKRHGQSRGRVGAPPCHARPALPFERSLRAVPERWRFVYPRSLGLLSVRFLEVLRFGGWGGRVGGLSTEPEDMGQERDSTLRGPHGLKTIGIRKMVETMGSCSGSMLVCRGVIRVSVYDSSLSV